MNFLRMRVPGTHLTWTTLARELIAAWKRDNVSNLAGALTFFGVLALVPFLLFLVALSSVVIQPEQVQQIFDSLDRAAPSQVNAILHGELRHILRRPSFDLLTLGFLGTIWSASGAMSGLRRGLNAVHGVAESRPFWKARGVAVLMTVATAVLFLAGALIALAGPLVGRLLGGTAEQVIGVLRLPVAVLLTIFGWALIFWALPDVKQPFRVFTPGAVVGVLLWAIASWGFSLFVAGFGHYEATYGTLGGVIVLLLWMWISAQTLLFGAELNGVLDRARAHPPEPARVRPTPEAPRRASDVRARHLAALLGLLALRRRRRA